MEEEISIDLLERPPKTLSLLVYLHKHGPSNMSEIKKGLDIAAQTLYSATKRLKELNLVFEKSKRGFPKKVFLNLTRHGTELAESLSKANMVVGGTIVAFKKKLATLRKRRKTKETKREMIDILCRLGELFHAQGKWDEALDYCRECSLLAKELHDVQNEGISNLILGEVHMRRGQIDVALGHLKLSSKLFSQSGDMVNLSSVHYMLGAMYEEKGSFDEALSEYKKSEEYAEEADHEISHGKAILGVGRILGKKGEYEKSYLEMKKAVRDLEESNALDELPLGYANLGATAFFLNVDEAMKWFRKSIEVAEEMGDMRLIGCGWMNVAACLIDEKRYNEALQHLKRALPELTRIDEKGMLSSLHIQFGIVYREQGKWTDARESFGEAIDLAKEWDKPYNLADALLNQALLDIATSSTKKAKMRLERALKIFKELKSDDKVSEIQKRLDEINQ
ncbi:MAG: tetratricopeptide repeat protein [Methanobacteriota archaeon]|nr:MAG: tetratricopeptide repeat protein [Euryarchaeota archaeon]